MELMCVPLLAGLLVFITYYSAYNRGYGKGYSKAVETVMLVDLGSRIEEASQEYKDLLWRGTGEEGGFEGIGHLIPEDEEL